ncbi:MAG TPA: tripartite tricarboxylate transporter substrate binding protein [Ramlibacter sp.]|nr:tripartite tricarboxylate transporter substrate binding protein [Ramlibacter sp.]
MFMTAFRTAIAAVLAAAAFGAAPAALAQTAGFPGKPITVVVPFAAGGTADVVARVFGEKVGAELGQPVLVDNRAGGNGIIGAQAVARARPDGYTILQVSTTHVILPSLQANLPYDWKKDLVPLFGNTEVPQVITVSGKSNIRTMADLAAAGKATPDGLNYASGGTGTLGHLTSALVVQNMKIKATHVAYRGLSPAAQAVLGEQAHFATLNVPEVLELAKAGSLRLLAVTSEHRLPYLPEVPTLKELGFSEPISVSWTANLVPANTPPEVIERLQKAYAKAAADPAVRERLGKLGVELRSLNGPELGRFMSEQEARWRRVVEDNKIKMETN